MRIFALLAVIFFGGATAAQVQTGQGGHPAPERSYKLGREEEDWSFLRDPSLRQDFWDPIKYIPLRRRRATDYFLTISGEARERWEQTGNNNWGEQPFWNSFFLQRYMLGFDFHLGRNFRTYVEFKTGIESFRIGGPRPIDEKRLDFQKAFFEVGSAGDRKWIKFRAGVQGLRYGAGRLIDVREGPNVRLSFAGFKVMTKIGPWFTDGFAVRPREDNFGFFDDQPNPQVEFWGIYSTRPSKRFSVDAYYLGLDRKQATFQRGTAHEVRQSIGGRLWRPIATERPGLDFDYESLFQFGTFGSANIRAWTVASDTGYSVPTWQLKPRFELKADVSSGDDPKTNTLGTFNALFPIGNYFGVFVGTGPGPVNFMDLHPRVSTNWGHGVKVTTDWLFYWRESLSDGVYSVPGNLIRAADESTARFVGHGPGVDVRWQANAHLWFQGDYGIFYAGPFLKETQPGRNLNYWALWADYKF